MTITPAGLIVDTIKEMGERFVKAWKTGKGSDSTARMPAGMAEIMGAEFIEMVRARTYSVLNRRPDAFAIDGNRGRIASEVVTASRRRL